MTTTTAADRALVLFSGGQDSTVCLAWALSRFAHVETIGFDYGQRHAVELACRTDVLAKFRAAFADWAGRLGPDQMVDLAGLGALSETALTRDRQIEMTAAGLPSTFVPGRNLAFLTYAAAYAYRRDLPTLVGGMCETDYSGYPDCRRATLDAMAGALSLGMDRAFKIATPLMYLDKAATWALGAKLGGTVLIDIILEATHTCYLGDRQTRHAWGYGCGTCPACKLRAQGYVTWRANASA